MMPSVEAQLQMLADKKAAAQKAVQRAMATSTQFAGAADHSMLTERRLESSISRWVALRQNAARVGEVRQAEAALHAIDAELRALPDAALAMTDEEAAEKADVAAAQARAATELERVEAFRTQAQARIDAALRALPAVFDPAAVQAARAACATATQALQDAEARETNAVRRSEQGLSLGRQIELAATALDRAVRRAADVERELGVWSLLSKCLSNDGVIALDIDDVGPTLAALANDLLLACYGARFTLELVTQSKTARGELREDFDIIVHDGLRDEAKSLKLVSGGERVWINECLTRAIALHLASDAARRFGTVFSDEADGPLDTEHKRMFMAMKREVLRPGNYEREFFVSQTPELTAMADAVIDLDKLAVAEVS